MSDLAAPAATGAPGTPGGSLPVTPIHSIHTMRRKAAGHSGPLTKILVANRGEIAVRVFRTAHELAMHTVAIYSFEDRLSAHRQKADEAYQVGKGLTPVGAYLAQDSIIDIALEHEVDMIHPGYGFLSENAVFARKVEEAGIAWVGPTPEAIDALGDKTKARTIAMQCGVPCVPGTPGPIASYQEAAKFIEEHGFPVIIKAAMGGGGRGMRVVREQSELESSFTRAVSEAKSAFGDGTVFIERFLDRPRHIEVQILADGQGNVIHLFERDCSVQRRHQKVVEVAPAMHLPENVRQAMFADAIKIAQAVNYRNAGTCEFLVDQLGRHYFIEINPRIQVEHTITVGWRNIIVKKGPEAFAKAVRAYPGCLIMDTTWRDAHQSLLATRLRTIDMVNIAKETSWAMANAYSLECWGGATFDVAMRFLYEDPWERLRALRKLVPNIPFQALFRGANAVGYTSYPDNVIYDFCKKAVENGLDIFRVFDSLNYIDNMKLGIDAAKKAGGVCEAVVCYSGDVADPKKTKYTLDYYMGFVDQLVAEGIHVLGIKDMAGLLKPQAATMLIGAIRKKYPDLPIHVHSHDTAGIAVSSMLAAAAAGADVVDLAIDSMSGLTSQPAMGAVCAALEQNNLGTGIRYDDIQALNLYWTQVRMMYSCFEANVRASDSSVFEHEMPGGQYTNLMFQASQLGLGTQWSEIKRKYIEANKLCGDIIKVTPSSKVVGDFAQWMTSNNLTAQDVVDRAETLDFPTSVVEFFQGYLGQPVGGFPEPLRSKVIRNKPKIEARPGESMAPLDLRKIKQELRAKFGKHITDVDVASYCMYPKVFEEYQGFLSRYGDLSVLPTRYFLGRPTVGEEMHISIEKGKMLIIRLMATGALIDGTGSRDVWFEVNGEVRAVPVEDKNAAVDTVTREKASSDPGSVGAPMSGVVIEVRVKEGQEVKKGDVLCVQSAMKAPPKAKGGRMLALINHIVKITMNDGRTLMGKMLAFDRHMNLVLADCEEFRRIKKKRKQGDQEVSESVEQKRTLGLVILRGETIVSLTDEGAPASADDDKKGNLMPGPGRGMPAGRGMGMMPPPGGVPPPSMAARPMPYGMPPPGMPGGPPPGMPGFGRGGFPPGPPGFPGMPPPGFGGPPPGFQPPPS
ncbi:pyruvate carboxylase [Tulasnella sp. 417]|nr:pyruvate carboxylase [Tulasnella sp. 417]